MDKLRTDFNITKKDEYICQYIFGYAIRLSDNTLDILEYFIDCLRKAVINNDDDIKDAVLFHYVLQTT